VREAFNARAGVFAMSCDLAPADDGRDDFHHCGSVLDILSDGWDLMIAHPPCTHLAVSGALHFHRKRQEQTEALDFVRLLMDAPIERICIENPVSVISSQIRKPNQIIQPWQFGHPEAKKTCLWLKNLPILTHTKVLPLPACGYWQNQTPSGQNKLGPSPTRAQDRARTYAGIAKAMADQWTF
jgi:hypothetical protein